tara:strand:+ start:172 stop:333 length:162 start_codon:yes stop_codon:yes gene_type:complete
VQLKASDTVALQQVFIKFQFQIGAIKGQGVFINTMPIPVFQFQIGAIKGQDLW